MRNDEFRLEHGSTLHYTVWSELAPPPPTSCAPRRQGPMPDYGVYLAAARRDHARARAQLARQITRGLDNNYDKAIAIERWLEDEPAATRSSSPIPASTEPIDFFLFDRKKGHCEYFASAFAVLARAVGIPTRQVNGFLGGEWNEYQGYVAVRAGDAHSWAEVYFPGKGWVTFDPTPAADGGALGRGGTGWRAKLGALRRHAALPVDEVGHRVRPRRAARAVQGHRQRAQGGARSTVRDVARRRAPAGGAMAVAARARRRGDRAACGAGAPRRRRWPPRASHAPATRSPIAAIYDQRRAPARQGGPRPRRRRVTPRELADRMATRRSRRRPRSAS